MIHLNNVAKESRCKGTAKFRNVQYLKDGIYHTWGRRCTPQNPLRFKKINQKINHLESSALRGRL